MLRQRRAARSLLRPTFHVPARRDFFGLGKKNDAGSDKGGEKGFSFNFDEQKLRAMQELFSKQSPEKQAELVKKALELQKTFGMIPGMGKLAQKNIEMLTKFAGSTQSAQEPRSVERGAATVTSSGTDAGPRGGTSGLSRGAKGPTIDELKKINLGPEIEALFAELSSMRAKKNSYRDKHLATSEELEKLQKEVAELRATDANLRAKLRKVEQDVLRLNCENMELKEREKDWKKAQVMNEKLTSRVQSLQNDSAAQDRQRSDALVVQLRERDDALRSMQRKLDRLRRRDPMAQFSRLCNNVARLCDSAVGEAKEISDDSFAALQSAYLREQELAWKRAAQHDSAAARAYVAVVRRFYLNHCPYARYDALISCPETCVSVLSEVVREQGFSVEHISGERYVVMSPPTTSSSTTLKSSGTLGPYGVCMALYLAGKISADENVLALRLNAVYPHVSATLFNDASRCTVQYETARSSGPGGQAVNVAETQVTAKLSIDGIVAYTVEAQESRSALANRELATEKLGNARRQHYNEHLVKQNKSEGVERRMVALLEEKLGDDGIVTSSKAVPGSVVGQETCVELVREAVAKGTLARSELGLVLGMQHLFQQLKKTQQ
ncbi:RF 1 domain [Trypanosoma vivax]|uniref:Prokaryotic-type class I peptide chain release factors domain-containing protein n=1 Tax=Trypanosoma vivax (strain Y486) TaxID=1055687 RepID=G0U575_TRYVY|nr:RF 1 domain [Trypanosoma vivax]CCC51023.1 conserved hypothetical protein [Trypanosoma vivax Y486]